MLLGCASAYFLAVYTINIIITQMVTIIQLFITNVTILITMQHNNHITKNTINLIVQCTSDPACPFYSKFSHCSRKAIPYDIVPLIAIAI